MANENPFRGAVNLALNRENQYNIERTLPDAIIRHDISDEELQMLADSRRDWTMEAFWGVIGAAIGTAKGAFFALFGAYMTGKIPSGDLFEVILFFVCLALGAMLLIVYLSRSSRSQNIVDNIRDRRRTG